MTFARDFTGTRLAISPDVNLRIVTSNLGASSNSNEPVLFFLHFAGGSAETWTSVINHLPPTQPTVAIDFRGWNDSTGPEDRTSYSIPNLADDVEAVITHLGLRSVVLVGLSMGGKVAMTVAGRQGKGDGPVKGVVLVGPASPLPMELSPEMQAQQLAAYSSRDAAAFVARNVLTWPGHGLGIDVYDEIAAGLLKHSGVANEAWPTVGMRDDVVALARQIGKTTLLVAGEHDMVEPKEKMEKEVLPNLQGAKYVLLTETGHLMPYEVPEKLAEAIHDFVTSLV